LMPFAAQAEAGNVAILRGVWNMPYTDEMGAVPYGTYRDQADATAGAFNKLNEPTAKLSVGKHSGFNRVRKSRSYTGWR